MQKPGWDYLCSESLECFDCDSNSYYLETDLVNVVDYYQLIESYPEKSFLE